MEELMVKAAKLGWIDALLVSYNFRLMSSGKMRDAVEACSKAGIGLTAMKTQGGGPVSIESETELQLAGRFMQKGFTDAQAKLKAVWEEPGIASICSQMPSMTVLMSNIAAAMDRTKLSAADLELFSRHAAETASSYCAGCTNICEPVLSPHAPVGDIMRYLMYHNSYGDVERAKACFAQIPPEIRAGLGTIDYSRAEDLCPQELRIGEIIKKASSVLA
jgi:predicted aldo/keto reductase-like oxidoreductase